MMPNVTKSFAFARWCNSVCCPRCQSQEVIKRGKDDTQAHRQRYQCKGCSFHA
ncbi:MAG: transposase [Gloeocapsa sp. UFS-A4-WI-NPMV-4B04]|nr:transposase [Gloeocapsa sp. UFS-A4-WI-NPMV-4B04]